LEFANKGNSNWLYLFNRAAKNCGTNAAQVDRIWFSRAAKIFGIGLKVTQKLTASIQPCSENN
jgi:hypothetical protein